MTAAITSEHRFLRTNDGYIWSRGSYSYNFWTRYLDVFDRVRVIARVCDVESVSREYRHCIGDSVEYYPMPYYHGPLQYAMAYRAVQAAAARAVGPDDAVILRVPSVIGSAVHRSFGDSKRPYAVEVVGDPYDVCAPGAMRHPIRPILRWISPRRMRQQCAAACGVAYVSSQDLPRRYPNRKASAHITHYSSIELTDSAIVPEPRLYRAKPGPVRLSTVGSLEQLYKGTDTLINAMAALRAEGQDFCLTIVGDGKHRGELETLTRTLGAGGYIRFAGQVASGQAVREILDASDLFVLPSRTEGLPRAMIEAMARGLPCIGTRVGGIPELLDDAEMVPPGDPAALAAKISEVARDPGRMTRLSARNLAKAQEYRDDVLRERRNAFYRHVRDATESWLAGQVHI